MVLGSRKSRHGETMDRETALEYVLTIARQIAEPVTWEDPDDLREDLRRALHDYDNAPKGDEEEA